MILRSPISHRSQAFLLLAFLLLLPSLTQAQTIDDCPSVADLGSSRLICTSGTAANPDRDTGAVPALHKFVPFPFDPPAFFCLGDSNLSDSMRSASATYLYRVDTNNGWVFEVEYRCQMTFPIGATGPKPEFSVRILDSTGASIDPVCLEAVYSGDNSALWTQRTDNMVHLSINPKFVSFDLRPLHGRTVQIRFNSTCRSAVQSNCLAQFSIGCAPLDSIFHAIQCERYRHYSAPRGFRYIWTLAIDTLTVLGTQQDFHDYGNPVNLRKLRCCLSFDSPTYTNTCHVADLYAIPYREFTAHHDPYFQLEHIFQWDTLGYISSGTCAVQLRLTDSSLISVRDSNCTRLAHDSVFFTSEYRLISECDTLVFPDTTTLFTIPVGRYSFQRWVYTYNNCVFPFLRNLDIPQFPCSHYDTLIRTCPDDIDICSLRHKCWFGDSIYNDLRSFPFALDYFGNSRDLIHSYHHHRHIDSPGLDPYTNNLLNTVPSGFSYSFLLGDDFSPYTRYDESEKQNLSFQYHVDTAQSGILILRYALVMRHQSDTYHPRFFFRILDSSGRVLNPSLYSLNITKSSSTGWRTGSAPDIFWRDWAVHVIDLHPLHGQTLTFHVADYSTEGRPTQYSYAYIHFQCLPGNISAVRCMDSVYYLAPQGWNCEWFPAGRPDSVISTAQDFAATVDSLFYCRITDPSDTAIHINLLATPPPPQYPLARLSLDTLEILDDCSYLLRFINRSVIATEHAPDSITTTPCNDISCWLDDTILVFPDTVNLDQKSSFRATPGQHTLTLVARTTGTACIDTLVFHLLLSDPCLCLDTVFDTIVQNQLPHTWHDITFTLDSFNSQFSTLNSQLIYDTSLLIPGIRPLCDSLIDYHLTLYPNTLDSAIFVLCPNAIPFRLNDSVLIGRDTVVLFLGAHGEDSTVTYRVIMLHDSDTSITDTILERQLPWLFLDTLFTDSASNVPIVLVNEQGCDSVIHYSLYIFWDGDHCDTSLVFPTLVTPNGDGINDRFVIGGLLENNCFRFNDLLIYDRTGQLVYHGHNIARDEDFWDPAAHRAPDATYFYVFKAHGVTIHTMHQGVIEVLR